MDKMIRRFIVLSASLFITILLHAQRINAYKIDELVARLNNKDSVFVINFWATWCAPCVEELPYFLSITKKYKNDKVKLLLVSLDFKEAYPGKIENFAKRGKFDAEILWLNETNADEFCPKIDPAWSGGIPSTLIINNRNGYRKFSEAKMKPEELEASIKAALK